MFVSSGILLEVHSSNIKSGQMPTSNDREFVLRDLIAFRNVRIEIIFPVKFGKIGDLAVQRQTDFNHLLDRALVYNRQRSGVSGANRADVHIWPRLVRIVLAGAE